MEKKKIKVSIIVPVYNVEHYLEQCLSSLVSQTLDSYEIIVVNDGSPDNSQDIIDRFVKDYPDRVKGFAKENGGLSDARNYGVSKASGEYIGFVDSDDYVREDMFELLYNKAKEDDSDIVYSSFVCFDEKKIRKQYFKERINNKGNIKVDPYILYDASSYAWNKLYKKSFWDKNKFVFPIQWFEDSALIYNVMLCANVISCVNEPLYYYRQDRSGAITNSINMKIFDIFKSAESIIKFYKEYLKEDYSKYELYVEYLCVKHFYVRVRSLSKSDDNKIIKKFINEMYEFLNNNFTNFTNCSFLQTNRRTSVKMRIYKYIFKHRKLLIIYRTFPKKLRKIFNFVYSCLSKFYKMKKKNVKKINAKKRYFISKNGLDVLVNVQDLLTSLGILNFADFGTLLGLVREKGLLKHDLDMDVGVFATEEEKVKIRMLLEKKGYKVWRSYYFDNKIVEDSFRYKGIKVDINYYEQKDNKSVTWLFYKKPHTKYDDLNDRSIVEMNYSKILKTKKIKIEDYQVNIPVNAKKILAEKYGESWEIPDTGWIYWTSPAAVPIEPIGKFFTYEYKNFPYVELDNNEKNFHIKKLQDIELEILKEVDRVCKENDITYYLGEGTLLGAMRHNGFIPWDDDIDILMPRSDYEKFIKIADEKLNNKYVVQHYKITEKYWSIFMKVRLKDNSLFYQSTLDHLTDCNGPYIDIFPLDKVGDVSIKKLINNKRKITFFRKILSYKLKETKPKTLKTLFIYPFIYVFSLKSIYKNVEKLYHKYDDENGKYYVNYASYYGIKKQRCSIDCYGTPKQIDFCGLSLSIPNKANLILRSIYGDYMTLPLKEKRSVKHSFEMREENGKTKAITKNRFRNFKRNR